MLAEIIQSMCFRKSFLVLLWFSTAQVLAGEYQPYLDLRSQFYSQPIAIKSIIDDWKPPFKGGDKALSYNRAETGVHWRNWQFGVLERYEYFLEFSPETAELFYLVENRLPLETGKQYALRIKVQQQRTRGLRLGYRHVFDNNKFALGLGAAFLQGKTLTEGDIQGSAHVTAENDYDFQFDVDYFYSRDVLFDRDVRAPRGNGYSLDIKLEWDPNEQFSAQLDIVDMLGEIFWTDTPYTRATGTSENKRYDENGYVRYDPIISGTETNKNFTQTLQRKVFLNARYRWIANGDLLAEVQDFGVERFSSIGAGWCYRHVNCFQGLFNTTAEALVFRYHRNNLRIELASDHRLIDRARYLAVQFYFNRVI